MEYSVTNIILMDNGTDPGEPWKLAQQKTEDMRQAARVVTVIVGVETVLGFFGNLLVLYVFLFRYHACSYRYFVLCLAVTDLISTLTTMPGEIITQTFWFTYPYPNLCKIKSFFNVFTVGAETGCLLLIAIERYQKICRPFKKQMKPSRALLMCGLAYVLAFGCAVPCGISWGTQETISNIKGVNVTLVTCLVDDNVDGTSPPFIYSVVLEAISCLLLITMLVLYILIARVLCKKRRPSSGLSQEALHPTTNLGNDTSAKNNERDNQNVKTDKQVTEMINTLVITREESPNRTTNAVHDSSSSKSNALEDQEPHTNKRIRGEDQKLGKDQMKHVDEGTCDDKLSVSQIQPTVLAFIEEQTAPDTPATCEKKTAINGQTRRKMQSPDRHRLAELETTMVKKTLIMFILTGVFIITTILYFTLLSLIARDILQPLSNSERAVYFFFFRLYFINHVINPVVYGLLDSKFQGVLRNMKQSVLMYLRRSD